MLVADETQHPVQVAHLCRLVFETWLLEADSG